MEFYTRHLPHWHPDGAPLFLTFSLHGAFPRNRFPPPKALPAGKAFVYMDHYLDTATAGPMWLKQPEIAQIAVNSLRFGEHNRHYDLHAWVVMPNHVHMLITPLIAVPKLMQSLKTFTAREANKLLGRTGPFWQHESYDHCVRDNRQFDKIRQYIDDNPVRAGLSKTPEAYPFSSAYAGETPALQKTFASESAIPEA